MSEYDGSIEIRPDGNGGIDEIVGNGVFVHIERMNKGSWFISLTRPDQTQEVFWLDGKGKVEFTLTESRPAPEAGPNAMPWTLTSSFAAGRLAGLREAAEVIDDMRREHQASVVNGDDGPTPVNRHYVAANDLARAHKAILALAEGGEG